MNKADKLREIKERFDLGDVDDKLLGDLVFGDYDKSLFHNWSDMDTEWVLCVGIEKEKGRGVVNFNPKLQENNHLIISTENSIVTLENILKGLKEEQNENDR